MKRVQSSSGVAVPVERGDDEGCDHAAAEQGPEGEALPASRLRRRPDAEGRGEESPEQEQVEDDAGAEAAGEDEICHGLGNNQIPFAEMRQLVDGFATASRRSIDS